MEFIKYANSIRKYWQNGQSKHFILGNSGADYDSIFGSIIYAFYMTSYLNILHLPLIDCPQKDIKLRFQVAYILQQYGIQKQNLLYTDMIPNLFNQNKQNGYKVLLYDHNFRKQLSESNIQEIIDHHDIQDQIKCPSSILHCGSALTLLYYIYNPDSLNQFKGSQFSQNIQKFIGQTKKSKVNLDYDIVINELIYYGILLDTFNFAPSQKGRWNQYDKYAYQQIIKSSKPKLTQENIEKIKTSVQRSLQLTLEQHMRKDFKAITYGDFVVRYSTILLDPEIFIDYYWNQVKEKYAEFLDENTGYCLMFAHEDKQGNLKRQIIYYSANQKIQTVIQTLLAHMKMKQLQNLGQWRRWEDPTSKISRKIFDKNLREHFAKL